MLDESGSHLAAQAPHWVTGPQGCACAMCVSISRVSDHCVIILPRRKRAGMPAWCPLDEGRSWHLSVSGQPRMAPSISLADSRGPKASLTPLLHRLYAALPGFAEGQHIQAHKCKHTHTLAKSYLTKKYLAIVARLTDHHDCLWHLLPSVFLVFLSSYCLVPEHIFSPSLRPSSPPLAPSCPLKSMVNSCSTWLCDR